MKRRYRLLAISVGIGLLVVAAVAQFTSHLTPILADYPLLLEIMGSLGLYLLMVSVAVFSYLYSRLQRKAYAYIGAVAFLALIGVLSTPLGAALQLSLASLTIGGSLLILGCSKDLFNSKTKNG